MPIQTEGFTAGPLIRLFLRRFCNLTFINIEVQQQNDQKQCAPDNLFVEIRDALVHAEPGTDHLDDHDCHTYSLDVAFAAGRIDPAHDRDHDRLHGVGGTIVRLGRAVAPKHDNSGHCGQKTDHHIVEHRKLHIVEAGECRCLHIGTHHLDLVAQRRLADDKDHDCRAEDKDDRRHGDPGHLHADKGR